MKTFSFTNTDSVFSFSIDGRNIGTWTRNPQADSEVKLRLAEGKIFIQLQNNYVLGVIESGDTVSANSADVTGTVSEKYATLKPVVYSAEDEALLNTSLGNPAKIVVEENESGDLTLAAAKL